MEKNDEEVACVVADDDGSRGVCRRCLDFRADGASIPVYQFTSDNVNLIKNPSQPNQPANSLTLSVKAGTSVYLSNMVDSWWKNGNEIEPLGMTYQERMASGNNIMRDYDRGYDMSAGKYGYMFVETGTIKPLDGIVHYGTGETVDIQYAQDVRALIATPINMVN